MTRCFGHRATAVLDVSFELQSKRFVDGLHVADGRRAPVLSGADWNDRVVDVRVAVLAIAHDQVGRR